MLIKRKRGWEIPEHLATPEHVFLNRRVILAGMAAVGATALSGRPALAAPYPAKRNEIYTLDRPLTPEKITGNYNNFYEYGTSKKVASAAEQLKTEPWSVRIDGMVAKEMTLSVDDIVAKIGLEERLYRHRCVEAWSMAVPWTGFPLAKLVALAAPTSGAKFVRFETFNDPKMAPGLAQSWYPWPYVEGVTMAEAGNDLAFIATGIYGKALPKVFGAPIRLVLPWKYGFKSIKSIVRVSFTDKRPVGMWEQLQASEYGFWANVNPQVPHPRWSQATETFLNTGERVPTQLFNGYGSYVADLYKGLEKERLWA
jgi:sulfoxide reductase catalytic subunit YedY